MASNYRGTRDVKKEHYNLGILLTEEKKIEILKDHFKRRVGYELNIENPRSFNEKIVWSKLYYQNPLITQCCDKYAVKDYVKKVIGEEYVVPTIAQWDDPDDIDYDQLPDQFVLKVNWSSGYNIICHNKAELDVDATRAKLKKWIEPDRNSYYQFFNWGFKHVKPVIYAEEYLEQSNGQLYDYKFHCFNGESKLLLIASDRYGDQGVAFDFFDRDFNPLPFTRGGRQSTKPVKKPELYEEMIRMAEVLAKPFPFVRIDFYEVNGKIYLGEMTFYPGGGILPFDPVEWDYTIGEWYELPPKMITDKEGPFYRFRVAAVRNWKKMKNKLRNMRRKIIRHDVIGKKHYVTLFSRIRFLVVINKEGGWKYASVPEMQVKYKRIEMVQKENEVVLETPEFIPLEPMQAYIMEDKITFDMKKHYCEQKAYKQLRYFPNLDAPKSFNEKLIWLALNYKNPHHKVASDKARAKEWISERIGSEYVVPLIGTYSNVNDIDFEALPDRFVMKANEGWGADEVILVEDKSKYDIDCLKAHASKWLYPWSSYYYNNMCITDEKPERPLVVIEEYLEHEGSKYLDDYKFYCCNGEVKFALIINDRGSKHQSRTFVDADWNVLPVRRAGKFSGMAPKKPKNLDKMYELARELCKEVPLVRIDFYNLDGKIYVGEMTFTPGMFLRFEPRAWDYKLGEYLDLTDVMKEVAGQKNTNQ